MIWASRGAGVVLVVTSAAAYSTAGLFTRLIPLDVWTILFWRGIFAGLLIAAVFAVMERGRSFGAVRAIGRAGLIAALCSGLATIMFISAFRLTSVADVVIIFATAPFVTAAIARVWYGTRESRATLVASAVALIGVIVMMSGVDSGHRLAGELLAIGVTLLMSLMMVIIRAHQDTPMLPAASLSALLCAALVAPIAMPLRVSGNELWLLLLFGTTQFGLGLILLTLGTRLVSATESAFLQTIEVPLAAVWVWLAFGEVPAVTTMLGGVVILGAVIVHTATPVMWGSAEKVYADARG
ncbi:MAG: DMT family transporter [Acetobacteraceae bacterium]|nr:DMT family transporter [Acetobacteraceae bacterium]